MPLFNLLDARPEEMARRERLRDKGCPGARPLPERGTGVQSGDVTLRRAGMEERKAAILAEIPRLRRYARALLRDRDSADDLVQDCLERALARLDHLRAGEDARRWLL